MQLQRGFSDFVQKQRAAVGQLEFALVAAAPGPRERPFFMAEQFAGDQIPGNGAAVDGDIGAVFPVALIVNGLGENIFAGSALSQKQNIGAASGNHSGLLHRHQEKGVLSLNVLKAEIGGRPHHPGHHGLGPLDFIEDNNLADDVFAGRQNRVARQREVSRKIFEENADFRVGDGFLIFDQVKELLVFPFKNIAQPPSVKIGILRKAEHVPGIVIHQRHMARGIHRNERLLNR